MTEENPENQVEGQTDQAVPDGQEADGTPDSPLSELEVALIERDEFKDIALRLQADFENYKKRVAATQSDETDRATGRLAEALLPVLDACEAAFTHGAEGVEPVWSALIGALQKQGPRPWTCSTSRSTPPSRRRSCRSQVTAVTPSSARCCAPGTRGRGACCAPRW